MDIPEKEPIEIVAGDTLQWKRNDLSDYPSSTWTLTYYLVGSTKYTITATADGTGYKIEVSSTTTATWTPGNYWLEGFVSKTGERYQIFYGTVKIRPNLEAQTTYDGRSHCKKVLDAIEAVIEGRASKDQMSITLTGRSISRIPISELLILRDRYRAEYNAERKAEKIRRGEDTGYKVAVRFVR